MANNYLTEPIMPGRTLTIIASLSGMEIKSGTDPALRGPLSRKSLRGRFVSGANQR